MEGWRDECSNEWVDWGGGRICVVCACVCGVCTYTVSIVKVVSGAWVLVLRVLVVVQLGSVWVRERQPQFVAPAARAPKSFHWCYVVRPQTEDCDGNEVEQATDRRCDASVNAVRCVAGNGTGRGATGRRDETARTGRATQVRQTLYAD